VSVTFNAQVFNYVLRTFYTEEPNERKKIGGYTMQKPSFLPSRICSAATEQCPEPILGENDRIDADAV